MRKTHNDSMMGGDLITTQTNSEGSIATYTDINGRTARYCIKQNDKYYRMEYGYNQGLVTSKFYWETDPYFDTKKQTIANYGYTYDAMNRLTSVKSGTTQLAAYEYDSMSNLKTTTLKNGVTTTYSYNMANLVTKMENKKGSATLSSYSYSYNFDGNQRSKTDHTGRKDAYTYDNMGRLTGEAVSGGLLSAPETTTYTYDYRGNRIQKDTNSSVTNYTYDGNNRLLKEVTSDKNSALKNISEYKYDKNGNMKSKANSLSGVNPTKTRGSINILTYDEFFALETPEVKKENFTYNVFNQLVTYSKNNRRYIEYSYYPNGLRSGKLVNYAQMYYFWDGDNMVFEAYSGGEMFYQYDYGLDLIRDSINDNYYVYNAHGDVTQLTDSNGNVKRDYEYDAFGNSEDVRNDKNPIRYAGENNEKYSGLIYLRNRYYDPSTGRFINEDPIRDGTNWYSYCNGNPVAYSDSQGLEYVVVSGGKYKYNKNDYKYEFIEPAIKNLIAFKNRNDGESLSWIIADEGWSDEDKYNFNYVAKEIVGCSIKFINDKSDLFNYINTKDDNSRYLDPIHAISVFSHGFETNGGTISLGYNYDGNNYNKKLNITSEDIKNSIYDTAFDNPDSWFGCCNLGNNTIDSFAQNWENKFKGRTWAYNGRSDYSKIVGRLDFKELRARKAKNKHGKAFGFSYVGSANYPVADKGAKMHEFYAAW